MILRSIKVTNFRQFAGAGEIRFAQPGDRNVTVILGQNGAGKTTLLNAFLWCFYGRIEVENDHELVCHKAVQDADIGDTIDLSVKVVFEDKGTAYTAYREARYEKIDGGRIEERSAPRFSISVRNPDGETKQADDPKNLIERLLPGKLSRFFFFRGEDMESLAMQRSGKDLSRGVEEFLNFNLLDKAIKVLKEVGSDYQNEFNRVDVVDVKAKNEEVAAVTESLEAENSKLETVLANKAALEESFEKVEKQMGELEETRPLLERKNELKQEKVMLRSKEEDDRKQLATVISRDGFLSATQAILDTPITLSDNARTLGELPAKIKPTFVDELLERGNCICGREFDDESKSHMEKWRGSDGLAALEVSVSTLRTRVEGLILRRERFQDEFQEARIRWSQTKLEIARNQGEISAVDSGLEGRDFGLENLNALETRLRQLNSGLVESSGDKVRTESKIEELTREHEELVRERDRLVSDKEEVKVINQRYHATDRVGKVLKQLRSDWLTIVQEYLDGRLKENWDKVAQLERQVEFTADFKLQIKERGPDGQWTTSAPSSANLRTLSLSFVSALIQLAADIRDEESQQSDGSHRQQPFQGGTYPLVMDAPFATMDQHFKRTVPSGLREVVPQIVLIINYDQWQGEVEEVLRSRIGEASVLELHTPGTESTDDAVSFEGQSIGYVVSEPDASTDWSIIKEVTL